LFEICPRYSQSRCRHCHEASTESDLQRRARLENVLT
jgi:hypothetical protein